MSEIDNQIEEEEAYLTKWLLFFYVIFVLLLWDEFPKASPPVWFRALAFGFVCWWVRESMGDGSLFDDDIKGGAILWVEFYKNVFIMAFGAVLICCVIDLFFYILIGQFDEYGDGGLIILYGWR